MTSSILKFATFVASLTHDVFDALPADAGNLLGTAHALESLEGGGDNVVEREQSEYIEKVVYLNRVSKTVKGGRVMKFSALDRACS